MSFFRRVWAFGLAADRIRASRQTTPRPRRIRGEQARRGVGVRRESSRREERRARFVFVFERRYRRRRRRRRRRCRREQGGRRRSRRLSRARASLGPRRARLGVGRRARRVRRGRAGRGHEGAAGGGGGGSGGGGGGGGGGERRFRRREAVRDGAFRHARRQELSGGRRRVVPGRGGRLVVLGGARPSARVQPRGARGRRGGPRVPRRRVAPSLSGPGPDPLRVAASRCRLGSRSRRERRRRRLRRLLRTRRSERADGGFETALSRWLFFRRRRARGPGLHFRSRPFLRDQVVHRGRRAQEREVRVLDQHEHGQRAARRRVFEKRRRRRRRDPRRLRGLGVGGRGVPGARARCRARAGGEEPKETRAPRRRRFFDIETDRGSPRLRRRLR